MKNILLSGILIYVGIGIYLYIEQRNLIYFPVKSTQGGLSENIYKNNGHAIKVAVLNEEKKRAIIYFGGNAENVEYNSEHFLTLFPEYTVYLVKYRGYGGSSGTPTEESIYSDSILIYDSISQAHDEVSIIGRSLGSAVATYVASRREINKLVLITPFDSIQNVAQSQLPIYPMGILLKDKHDSYGRAKDIKAETLIIAAEKDRVIKMSHTKRLIDGFTNDVLFHVIEEVGHNSISSHPRYHGLLDEFFRPIIQ